MLQHPLTWERNRRGALDTTTWSFSVCVCVCVCVLLLRPGTYRFLRNNVFFLLCTNTGSKVLRCFRIESLLYQLDSMVCQSSLLTLLSRPGIKKHVPACSHFVNTCLPVECHSQLYRIQTQTMPLLKRCLLAVVIIFKMI